MRYPVIHISGEKGWRGGEVQLLLLVRQLRSVDGDRCIVPTASELANRLSGIATTRLRGFGFLHPLNAFSLHRLLRSIGPAIIHAHSSSALETAMLARIGLSTRLVVSRRTAFPVRSGWKYRSADAVIAVSEAAKQQLVIAKVDETKIVIIPDAVDAREKDQVKPNRNDISEDSVICLCAAAFTKEKGYDLLLHAWAGIEKSNKKAWLLLAGDGPLLGDMRALAAQLGLEQVRFLGWREDLPALIKGADIAVLSSRMEGLSTFLCEAQWHGLPVVATDSGGIPQAVLDRETGLLGRVGNVEVFTQNLLCLISSEKLRRRMGAAAQRHAHVNFAADRIAALHDNLYEGLSVD